MNSLTKPDFHSFINQRSTTESHCTPVKSGVESEGSAETTAQRGSSTFSEELEECESGSVEILNNLRYASIFFSAFPAILLLIHGT
jgi:hypothetical protein